MMGRELNDMNQLIDLMMTEKLVYTKIGNKVRQIMVLA